jgi:3-dehydroquinate synthase
MRGVPVVQVPTTLLAMTDASVGGKTGVDVRAGKNLVGAFHQPRVVLADPELLRTLPAEELRGGLAEAVKHGAIADAGYFDWITETAPALLRVDPASLTSLVIGSVRIKAGFVSVDVAEAGPRAALNFGHTIGHALERVTDYGLHHGQAVALGMLVEAELGERLGVTQPGTRTRLAGALQAVGLPIASPSIHAEQILDATRSDKKSRTGTVRFALLSAIGSLARGRNGEWTLPADDTLVVEALRSLQG